eukprot:CAMPEP_0205924002 /NCGR_PEP_ID=MMETSP1325-20131115/16724_1 /ASSEMBLY_ACC=CAM_ASM_000708 /TAXON_ID=236786 /ORGANISM="Florenciella sp., Strain RCC1007" /LENGTH=55 /DNA_ID=CAMNT_0053292293 /DNA_START=18 /DNA_END=181 /DNA_ORIENTATION=+
MNGGGRKKKRKRTSSMTEEDEAEGIEGGEDGEKRYVFLDRDPGLFGSCLQFMRSG